jgi:ADP-ribosylglycohydrolase
MLNKVQGCLVGLAIGDALGAPLEFQQSLMNREHLERVAQNLMEETSA